MSNNTPTPSIAAALRQIIEADDKQELTRQHIEIGRAALAAQPAAYRDSTPHLSVGDSSFESWYQAHPKATTGDKQLARDAYAAGMGDPLVAAAPVSGAQDARG